MKIEDSLPKVDILFFASSRSFDFYLSQKSITDELISCAGESSAKYIESKGFSVDFFPLMSGIVRDSAKEFANWVGGRTVGFSTSNLSKLSYSQFLSDQQFFVIPTYQTLYDTSLIPNSNYYIFTSPSNVDAFLKVNIFPANCRIISWGETTTAHLLSLGFVVYHTLKVSSDEALVMFLEDDLK